MTDIGNIDNYNGYPHIVQLNGIFDKLQEIVDQGLQGPPGEDGEDGTDGDNGWSPILSIESDDDRRVLRIVDWAGGEGTKPATGDYIGPTGLVSDPANAVDIRGPQGEDGADGDDGANDLLSLTDTPASFGNEGQVLAVNSAGDAVEWSDMEGGVTEFTELDDTPGSIGSQGQYLKSDIDSQEMPVIEWQDFSEPFTALTDVPSDYTGEGGQFLAVNGAEDAIEFVDAPTGGSSEFTELTDTPADYTGEAGQFLAVNDTEDGVEFVDAPGGGGASITEGTFTPEIQNYEGSYLNRSGWYMRIGDWVLIEYTLRWQAGSESRNIRIDNLPFPIDDFTDRTVIDVGVEEGVDDADCTAVRGYTFSTFNRIYHYDASGSEAQTDDVTTFSLRGKGWYKVDTS